MDKERWKKEIKSPLRWELNRFESRQLLICKRCELKWFEPREFLFFKRCEPHSATTVKEVRLVRATKVLEEKVVAGEVGGQEV